MKLSKLHNYIHFTAGKYLTNGINHQLKSSAMTNLFYNLFYNVGQELPHFITGSRIFEQYEFVSTTKIWDKDNMKGHIQVHHFDACKMESDQDSRESYAEWVLTVE